MSELKACPFCGKKDLIYDVEDHPELGSSPFVECLTKDCFGFTRVLYSDNVENAINKWNTRPLEDALQKRVEELEKLSNAHKKLACLMDQQQIDLRASISKAVELLEGELEFAKQFGTVNAPKRKEGYYDGRADAAWFALDILRRHGLIGGEW